MRDRSLLEIGLVLAPLSLLSVGGGQAVVAELHRRVVFEHGWLSEAEFLRDFVLSRMSPGPSSLIVMLIGAQRAGAAGAAVAVLAMFLPSSLLAFSVAWLWKRHHASGWRISIERGLAPIASALVLATAVTLLGTLQGGWAAMGIALVAALVALRTRLHPLILVGVGAALSLAWGEFRRVAG